MQSAATNAAGMTGEVLALRADRVKLCHLVFIPDRSPCRNPPLAGLAETSHPIDERRPFRSVGRWCPALPSHSLRRKPRRRSAKPASSAAMHLRFVGRLKHAPHSSPQGPGIAVTTQVAPLPSHRSVVGTPFVIHGNVSWSSKQSGAGPTYAFSHSIRGCPPPWPQSVPPV
jgi:hypothetical protein